jgi:hypothetical protein
VTRRAETLRTAGLLSAGALAVHQLRYRLVYGGGADRALEHQGHGYLSAVVPVVGLALAGVLAHLL